MPDKMLNGAVEEMEATIEFLLAEPQIDTIARLVVEFEELYGEFGFPKVGEA